MGFSLLVQAGHGYLLCWLRTCSSQSDGEAPVSTGLGNSRPTTNASARRQHGHQWSRRACCSRRARVLGTELAWISRGNGMTFNMKWGRWALGTGFGMQTPGTLYQKEHQVMQDKFLHVLCISSPFTTYPHECPLSSAQEVIFLSG